jgi:uncharacterized membrane protein
MGTDRNSNRPPSQVLVSESDRLAAASAALESAFDEARPQMMRWSVVTTALRDLVRARAQVDLSWVEIAHVATRWVEDLRTKGYSMTPEPSAMRTQGDMTRPGAEARPNAESPPSWIEGNGLRLLGMSIGVVFVWFGLLKPFAQSPVADLITRTLPWAPPTLVLHMVGWWEVATGVCLLVPRFARAAIVLLAVQAPALLLPFVVVPDACFAHVYALTLEGESLIKSLLLVAAAVVSCPGQARARGLL